MVSEESHLEHLTQTVPVLQTERSSGEIPTSYGNAKSVVRKGYEGLKIPGFRGGSMYQR